MRKTEIMREKVKEKIKLLFWNIKHRLREKAQSCAKQACVLHCFD